MTESRIKNIQKMMDLMEPKIKGVPIRNYPENEILGVPQRCYGYVNSEIKRIYGIDKLQTTNVHSCIFVAGYNINGSFLAHLDEVIVNDVPKMMEELSKRFIEKFEIYISRNIDLQEEWSKEIETTIEHYANSIRIAKKDSIQEFKIGMTLEGQLFHPIELVKNDSLYGDENLLWVDKPVSEIEIRKTLSCINHLEDKI